MRAQIQKWGNSLALRIPAAFARQMGLENGSTVDVRVSDDGELIVRTRVSFTLEELLAGVTPENVHPEFHAGPPRGKEMI